MDYIVLVCASRICGYAASYLRILLSATIGAVWSVIVLVSDGYIRNILHVCTYLVIGVIMTAVICSTFRVKRIIKGVAVLYGVTFAFAGAVQMLYSYTDYGAAVLRHVLASPQLALYVVVSLVALKLCFQSIFHIRNMSGFMYKVCIHTGNADFTVNALADTGNHLTDPYSGKPVSIIERAALPDNIDIGSKEKLHYVPISTVGCQSGVIQVFTAQRCRIYNENTEIIVDDILIGISENTISHGCDYEMLVNPDLIRMGE